MTPVPATAEIERLQRELAQVRTELEDFTYSVSHDLRAPLRHINAYAQIIEEDLGEQAPTVLATHLETIRQAARQMNQQIEALTALSRLARVDLQWSRLDLGALAHDVAGELAASHAGRDVQWQVAPDFPTLLGDAALIRQLLSHLLANALKFTASRARAEIKVSWQVACDGRCAVTLSDNGAGFDPQYKDKLFRPFSRLHPAHQFEGLGMGLALSRKIVQRHGGALWADAAPEAGCQVSFTLALAAADAHQICCA